MPNTPMPNRAMLNTNWDFYLGARALFPQLAERADRQYIDYWGTAPEPEESSYSWFASLASALNQDMSRGQFLEESAAFFDDIASVLSDCGAEVANCIDVSLVENLFWRVAPHKAAPYWNILPPPLQQLYVRFHGQAPAP